MTKQQIINALLHAKERYTWAIELDANSITDYSEALVFDFLDRGFCAYFRVYWHSEDDIISELKKELVYPNGTDLSELWYKSIGTLGWYWATTVDEIKQQALQPRLDHLNRTITRLQTELSLTNNTIDATKSN